MGTRFYVQTDTLVAAGGASAATLLLIRAPNDRGVRVIRAGVSFDGTNATDARAKVQFKKGQSDDGTGGTSVAGKIVCAGGESTNFLQTALRGAFSAEPAGGNIFRPHLHPVTQPYESIINYEMAPDERFGVEAFGASGRTGSCWLECELI